jgi:hypothetical protein
MAIIQISKIQQRSGNLVDLPQLDEAQIGWANDDKRLFIGASTPNPIENVEVLTSYSTISFSQVEGSGNSNVNITTPIQPGQILAYDISTNSWINTGGNANAPGNTAEDSGIPIHLGTIANVKIGGGATGYILETDGQGNLNWTSKGTLYTNIVALSNSTPIIMTVANTTPYTNGTEITISGVNGAANSYVNSLNFFVKLSNNFPSSGNVALYANADFTGPADGTGLTYTNSPNAIATSALASGGSGIAGGSVNTIQYNDSGVLNGSANFVLTGGNIVSLTGSFTATTITGPLTTASQPNITSVGTLTSLSSSGNINGLNIIGIHYGAATGLTSIPGANVSGAVPFATTANSVAGGNVSGAVSFATTANSVAGANVSGAVSFATTANSVAGANVSGQVGNALIAGTIYTNAQPNITSVGTLTSLTLTASTGTLTVPVITTGANTIAGTITGNWSLSSGSRLNATYSDLAEYYEADAIYQPGTVLAFGGNKEVTIAEDGTNKVAGVVSTDPAYVMNMKCPGKYIVALALQGRVPTKVRGIIRKGDMMISGGNGFARPTTNPKFGTIIGKALENFDGADGIIEIAVGRL